MANLLLQRLIVKDLYRLNQQGKESLSDRYPTREIFEARSAFKREKAASIIFLGKNTTTHILEAIDDSIGKEGDQHRYIGYDGDGLKVTEPGRRLIGPLWGGFIEEFFGKYSVLTASLFGGVLGSILTWILTKIFES